MENFNYNDSDKNWESYLYPNSDVLINKLGIRDNAELKAKDAEISFEKLVELYTNPIKGEFDAKHLRDIHRYLFGELYSWAGEYRYVNMQKQTGFTDYDNIEEYLSGELSMMQDEFKQVNNISNFSSFLATYYAQLLTIHPFREGNGRSSREFLREFVAEKSKTLPCGPLELDWTKFDSSVMNEDIQFALTFRGVIEHEFYKALVPAELDDSKKM